MNLEPILEQSLNADTFLKELQLKDGLIKDKVYSFFKDKDEAIFVAEYLRKLDLVNLVAATYNEPFRLITVNGGISTLLKNGGLTKIAIDRENQRKKQAERQTKQDICVEQQIVAKLLR